MQCMHVGTSSRPACNRKPAEIYCDIYPGGADQRTSAACQLRELQCSTEDAPSQPHSATRPGGGRPASTNLYIIFLALYHVGHGRQIAEAAFHQGAPSGSGKRAVLAIMKITHILSLQAGRVCSWLGASPQVSRYLPYLLAVWCDRKFVCNTRC